MVAVPGSGDAVHLPHEDRHPRDRRLVARVHRADASTDRVRALGLGADYEARLVHHVHDGQVELVAQVDHAHELVRRVAGQAARVVVGVRGEDAHGPALEPRKRRDQRAAVTGAQLEHGAAVEHEVEDAAHPVRLTALAGDDREQLLLAPVRRIGRGGERRGLPCALR